MTVKRSEAIRQFRARGASLIEDAARAMERDLPPELEVGHEVAVLLPVVVEEPSEGERMVS